MRIKNPIKTFKVEMSQSNEFFIKGNYVRIFYTFYSGFLGIVKCWVKVVI